MWASLLRHHTPDQYRRGFTIVELLIVIVVIGILAAITIVAFNGVQNKAKSSAAQSAVAQANKKIIAYGVENADVYPVAAGASGIDNLAAIGVVNSGGTSYQYSSTTSPRSFCVTATVSDRSYFISSTSTAPAEGACPGHGTGGASAITNLALNPHAVSGGGWTSQTPTGSTMTFVSNGAQDGGSAFQVATTTANVLRISTTQAIGNVSTGDTIAVSMDIFAPASTTSQIELGVNAMFPRSAVFTIAAGWNRVYGEVAIPAGTTNSPVTLVQLTSVPAVAASQTWKASRVLITKGPHTSAYADGYSSNWVWNGTPNASTSTGSPQ